MAREVHLKPKSAPVGLHNYLNEPFTFYWDKEPYTLQPGQTVTMFEWLATKGAIAMAERFFHLFPQNKDSKDPKVYGFISRFEDAFKDKVKEAIVYPDNSKPEISAIKSAVEGMNHEEEVVEKPDKKSIELKTYDDDAEPTTGCAECKATGPRHKPTCSKFKRHAKDEAQAHKLAEGTA